MTIMDRERYHFVQLTPAIRRRLEATVEHLIALLDALDGDADAGDVTACEGDDAYGESSQEFWSRAGLYPDDSEAVGDDEPAELLAWH